MKYIRKKLTDAEVVENTRKGLHILKWVSVAQICTTLILGYLFLPRILRFIFEFIENISKQEQSIVWIGFTAGMLLGILLMTVIGQLISMIVNAIRNLFGRRQDRLLVEYYDALMILKKQDKSVEQGHGA